MIETERARFFLEHPAPGGALAAGGDVLRGWLVGKPGTHFADLRVRIAGTVHPGALGMPRADLAAAFGSGEAFLPGGFEVPLRLPPGRHAVEFEGCELSGEWLPLHRGEIEVAPAAAATPGPARERLRAVEFGRAPRLLLRRQAREPRRTLAELAAELARQVPHPAVVRFAHRPLHGHFDEPAATGPGVFGRVPVVGWLFHETQRIRRVWGTFDLQLMQPLAPAGSVSGVAEAYPQFAHAAASRWLGTVDVPAQLPNPRCLRLYAELEDGTWHLANVQRTLVWGTEDEKSAYPRRSPALFARAVRSLHLALRARGVRVERGTPRWEEIAAVARDYRFVAPPARAPRPPRRRPVATSSRRLVLVSHNLNLEGAPLFLAELARHLAATSAWAPEVVAGAEGPLRARFESLGATVRIVPAAPVLAAPTRRAAHAAMRALAADLDFRGAGLVIANTLPSHWAVTAARSAGVPTLFYIHESTTPAAFFRHACDPRLVRVVEDAFAAATRVSFLTGATQRYYEGLSNGSNYVVTPGWIDLGAIDRYRAAHDRDAVRARLGLRPGERLVVNVGSVCERKGQTGFVRALDLLARRWPDLAAGTRFVMVGGRTTAYDDDLAALIAVAGRSGVAVVPETDEAPAYYHAADLFVCSSHEESFPRVVLEAMGFGCPIVSTAVHGVPEIVREGAEALLVPAGDTAALAGAMARALEQPGLAAGLAARARRRLEENFTAERMLPRHAALVAETVVAGA